MKDTKTNFEIKFGTENGRLWFGDGQGQLKLVASDLLDVAKKHGCENSGFTFCCSVYFDEESLTIVDCKKLWISQSKLIPGMASKTSSKTRKIDLLLCD